MPDRHRPCKLVCPFKGCLQRLEYMEKHSTVRLIGAHFGYNAGSQLPAAVGPLIKIIQPNPGQCGGGLRFEATAGAPCA